MVKKKEKKEFFHIHYDKKSCLLYYICIYFSRTWENRENREIAPLNLVSRSKACPNYLYLKLKHLSNTKV